MQAEKSPGQLVKEIAEDLSTLVRKEIELAKGEVGELVKSKLASAGLALVSLTMLLLFLPFLMLSLIEVLAIWLPRWGASLIITGMMLAIAGGAILAAKKMLGKKMKPEHTIRTLKEDVEWVKSLKK